MRPSPAAPGAGVTAGASTASLSFPALQALLSASVCAALCTYRLRLQAAPASLEAPVHPLWATPRRIRLRFVHCCVLSPVYIGNHT